MFDLQNFIERAMQGAGVTSAYGLAKATGLTEAAISNYRLGKKLPDDRAIVLLCQFTGDDPAMLAIQIHYERAANDEAKSLWGGMADRLKKSTKAAKTTVLFAIVAIASHQEPAQAASLHPALSVLGQQMQIVSNRKRVVASWFALAQALFSRTRSLPYLKLKTSPASV